MYVHGKHHPQDSTPLWHFPKSELPNSGCGLSASAAYTPVFAVIYILSNADLDAVQQVATTSDTMESEKIKHVWQLNFTGCQFGK